MLKTPLDVMKAIHEKMQNPNNWSLDGICIEVAKMASDAQYVNTIKGFTYNTMKAFQRHVKSWEFHTGASSFPVPISRESLNEYEDGGKEKAKEAYMVKDREDDRAFKWDRENSEYAELRWNLLEHVISELEKSDAEMAS